MVVNDLVSVLALLASPAFAAWFSVAAEQNTWFQSLSSNGKLAVIGGVSVFVALVALAAQQLIASRPDLLGVIDPYVKIALPIITFVFTQMVYGSRTNSKKFGASA